MKTTLGVASLGALALFTASSAHAAGIQIGEQGARATGMGSAVTAMIDDSSAIYYNPAGIARGKILDVQIGDSLIMPSSTYTGPGGAQTTTPFSAVPPFQAYISGGLTNHVSIGVGIFTPYGLAIGWPDGWVGRSLITSAALQTYDINPTVAFRLPLWRGGTLRLGIGAQIVRSTIDLKQQVRTGSQEASSELGADAWGGGANLGAQLDVVPQYLTFGAHYRSAVHFDFSGNAHFDNVPIELQGALHDQAVRTSLTSPDSLAVAVASHPIKRLVIDAEIGWYVWSKFHSLDITFPNDQSGTLSRSQVKNWNDTVNFRLGAELAITHAWRARLGVVYDPSPAPANTLTPDLPDADRLNIAAGLGYWHSSGFRIDLGYQFIMLFKRTSTAPQLPGDYEGMANIIGLSIGYRTPGIHHHEPR